MAQVSFHHLPSRNPQTRPKWQVVVTTGEYQVEPMEIGLGGYRYNFCISFASWAREWDLTELNTDHRRQSVQPFHLFEVAWVG